jgi:hypothetical protein
MNAAARMLGPGATRTYNDRGQWNGWQSSRGSVYWNHGDWAQGQGSSNFPHLNYDVSGKQGHLFMGDKIEAAGMTDAFDKHYEGRPTDGCK